MGAGRYALVIFWWGVTALGAAACLNSIFHNNLGGAAFGALMAVVGFYLARDASR